MNREQATSKHFADTALTRLLERAPAVDVPADFAARVRQALPVAAPARRKVGHGQAAAVCAALAIAVALFLLAPHTRPTVQSFAFWVEMFLIVELGGIVYWLGVKRGALQ